MAQKEDRLLIDDREIEEGNDDRGRVSQVLAPGVFVADPVGLVRVTVPEESPE
jgi:hypothetical protein